MLIKWCLVVWYIQCAEVIRNLFSYFNSRKNKIYLLWSPDEKWVLISNIRKHDLDFTHFSPNLLIFFFYLTPKVVFSSITYLLFINSRTSTVYNMQVLFTLFSSKKKKYYSIVWCHSASAAATAININIYYIVLMNKIE